MVEQMMPSVDLYNTLIAVKGAIYPVTEKIENGMKYAIIGDDENKVRYICPAYFGVLNENIT